MGMTPCVFLDRDGVLIELEWDKSRGVRAAPLSVDSVRLQRGVIPGLRLLRDAGYLLVLASNQPDAATGRTAIDDLHYVHMRFVHLLEEEGVSLDDYRYCFHHPDGNDPELGVACSCRKPLPGLILWAAADHAIDLSRSWMIGDRDKDIAAGKAAMCSTILIDPQPQRHAPNRLACPDRVTSTFLDAVGIILDW